MRTLEQQLSYEKLELMVGSSTVSSSMVKRARLVERTTSLFRRVLSTAIYRLTHCQDPRIWTSTIQSGPDAGQTIWHLYDPMTQRRATFASESDVRQWLDTRYYR